MLGIRIDQGWIGKCGSAVEAGIPTDTDSEATQTFRVVEQIGSIVPEVPNKCSSNMLVDSARVRSYEQVMTLLVDSGASQNFANLAALKKSPTIYEALRRDSQA